MKILKIGLFIILIGLNQLRCSAGDNNSAISLVSAAMVLKSCPQSKTVDMLYPIIKNNESIDKLAQVLDGLNVNQPFSDNVIELFKAGDDTPGLTALQLAVLLDRIEMVDYLLSLKNININQVSKRRTALDYCDFYNIVPILDLKNSIRPKIQKKLKESGALYGQEMKEYLKQKNLFSVTLKRLDV